MTSLLAWAWWKSTSRSSDEAHGRDRLLQLNERRIAVRQRVGTLRLSRTHPSGTGARKRLALRAGSTLPSDQNGFYGEPRSPTVPLFVGLCQQGRDDPNLRGSLDGRVFRV